MRTTLINIFILVLDTTTALCITQLLHAHLTTKLAFTKAIIKYQVKTKLDSDIDNK